MYIVFGVIFLLIGWRFGDWKNFERYYPTILFFMIGDLLYNLFTYNDPVWKYEKGWLLPNHTSVNLWIMVTLYPATVITYLFHFPKKRMKQLLYILFWVMLYVLCEFLAIRIFGVVHHFHGWSMWWSLLFDIIIFVMLPIHHKRPIVAWGFSIIIIIFFLNIFHVNLFKLQ